METIQLDFKGHVAYVRLDRPKAHAVNLRMTQDLQEAFGSLARSEYVRGVILTGQGNIFCAGLDIVELYGYDQEKMDQFWESFGFMLRHMVSFPKPLIAAINGHSPAGGCVFALCCDYRVMADGDFRIGLNEVPVGIVAPGPIVDLAAYAVGHGKASRMLLNGLLMTAREALDFGLIDEVAPRDKVVEAAEKRLEIWLGYNETAWRKTKERLRRPLVEALSVDAITAFGETNRAWWSPESRRAVGKTIERLKQRSSA